MHQTRNSVAAAALSLAALLCGCLREEKLAEAAPAEVDLGRVAFKVVHIAAPRVRAEDEKSQRTLAEAVGLASSVLGLDFVVFGGDAIANDQASSAPDALEAFASAAGIIAAKRYVVLGLGERERAGALPRADVLRILDTRKLIAARSGTYADSPRKGLLFVALDVKEDGSVAAEDEKAFLDLLKQSKEDVIVLAADQPPLDESVQQAIRRDPRVKLGLYRASKPEVAEQPGDAVWIATPPLDGPQPAVHLVEVDGLACKVSLLAVPGGAVRGTVPADLRPDRPAGRK
jgi:hypothetical protein